MTASRSGALVALLVVAAGGSASAQDRLSACMTESLAAFSSAGARPHAPEVTFLREREAKSWRVELDRPSCVGFLALGHRRIDDLDLMLHTASGLALVQDVAVDAHPYVRYCGGPGLTLVATALAYRGQGEVQVARIDDAPATLPAEIHGAAGCFAPVGGMRRPAVEVGPEPPGPSVDEGLAALDLRLTPLGWRRDGAAIRSQLGPRGQEAHSLPMQSGRCYAVAAIGGPTTVDVDLALAPEDGEIAAEDDARGRDALLKVCIERGESWRAEVRMTMGLGPYALAVYTLAEPAATRPAGLDGAARIAFAEVSSRIDARSMTTRPLAWGMLMPGQTLSMPVRLEAGRCYAFGGVPSDDLLGGDLDLVLLDDRDALVAWDVGRDATPLLWHCARRTGTYRVSGGVFGTRGRYLVLIGEPR